MGLGFRGVFLGFRVYAVELQMAEREHQGRQHKRPEVVVATHEGVEHPIDAHRPQVLLSLIPMSVVSTFNTQGSITSVKGGKEK